MVAPTTSIEGDKLRFTLYDAGVGNYTFTYTPKTADNALTGVATTVTVRVLAAPTTELPVSLATVYAAFASLGTGSGNTQANAKELQAAINAATPGTHIVVLDGDYRSRSYTLGVAGSLANPIIVKALNKNVPLFKQIVISAADAWVHGLWFKHAAASLTANGDRGKVLRCKFSELRTTTGNGTVLIGGSGDSLEIAYNEVWDIDGRGISFDNVDAATRPFQPWIHHNHFHDWVLAPRTATREPTTECIQLGRTQQPNGAPTLYSMQAIVEDNLFVNCHQDTGADDPEDETISVKCSYNIVRRNTFVNCQYFSNRFGNANEWSSNWIETSSGIETGIAIKGNDHRVINNYLTGTGAKIAVYSGDITQDEEIGSPKWPGPPTPNPSARDLHLTSNVTESGAVTIVGVTETGWLEIPTNIRLEDHTGTVTWDAYENRTITGTPSYTRPDPVKLTTSDVGPNTGTGPVIIPPKLAVSPVAAEVVDATSGDTLIGFNVDRTGDTTGTTSVNYLASGDFVADDYNPDGLPSGTLTFLAGQTRKTVNAALDAASQVGKKSILTISDALNGTILTPTASVSIIAPPTTTLPKYPPAATRTLRVPEDYSRISEALSASLPGDHISLADGTYNTDQTVTRSGSASGWIVIKARNHRKAIITGHWDVTADWIWFTGLTMARPGQTPGPDKNYAYDKGDYYSVWLKGKHNRVTNCRIDSPNGVRIYCDSGFRTQYVDICYNDFTGRTSPRWDQSNCIYMGRFPENSRGADNVIIARNKWYDSLPFNFQINGQDGRYCIYTGNSHPKNNNSGNNTTVEIFENYCKPGSITKGFYIKRGYIVYKNYVYVSGGAFTLRHGGYSNSAGVVFTTPPLTDAVRAYVYANNFDAGRVIINDTDHLIVSNRIGGSCDLRCGNSKNGGGFGQAAHRAILIGNTFGGKLTIGGMEDASYSLDTTQGGNVVGVKNYANGITQPSGANLIRANVVAGTAGYQELTGDSGRDTFTYVTAVSLVNSTGCDPEPT